MKTTRLVVAAFSLCALLAMLSVAPASGELSDVPQGEWGVSGLSTGSQSDGIGAPVLAMEELGSNIYVGGRFLDVTDGTNTTSQAALAAFDSHSGDWVSTFTPVFNGVVNALQASPDGTLLFVGGDFTTVNGVATGGLVALNPMTGAIDTSWTGRVGGYNLVRAFDVSDGWLYVGGGFTSVSSSTGGNAADRVARFDVTTGAHDASWFPLVAGGTVWGLAASPTLDRVYLAGNFDSSNGVAAPGGFVAVEASTSNNVAGMAAFSTNTQNASAQFNLDVVVTNGLVFVAGSQHYLQVLEESDLSLEVFHRSSSRGDYQSLVVDGDRVYAGCHCFSGTTLESSYDILWVGARPAGVDDGAVFYSATNSWLTAFDASTGLHIPGSTPSINTTGAGIWAMEVASDSCLWAGGAVTVAGDTPQFGFTRLCDPAIVDDDRPTTPTGLQRTQTAPHAINLSWGESSDAFEVAGYYVIDSDTGSTVLDVAGDTADLTDVSIGEHNYHVKAYDGVGNVSWRSNIVNIEILDVTRPTPPTALMLSISGLAEISLSWGGSTDDDAVAGYYIYDGVTDTIIADVSTTSASLTDLAIGSYQFQVRAYDAAGNISWRSNNPIIELLGDTERPSTPTALMAAISAGDTIDLAWTGSTDNVGVIGYVIFDDVTGLPVATTTETSIQLGSLVPGVYSFHVKAFDLAGNVSWRTNTVTSTLPIVL